MEAKFKVYLETIGITGALLSKVETIALFYSELLGYKLDDIFVSEYLNQDGSRVYEGLWFFNKEYCFEAKFFASEEDFDSDKMTNSVTYFNLKKSEYDIITNNPTDKSRATLIFGLKLPRHGELKATKENCKQLRHIFLTYIHPNYKETK